MKLTQALPIFAILCMMIVLSIPMMASSAQSGDEAQDFLVTLALMAVADDRMDGVLDTADLANLRDLVDLYYSDLPYTQMSDEDKTLIRKQGDEIIHQLDEKINFQKNRSNLMIRIELFEKMADQAYQRDPSPFGSEPENNPVLDVIAQMGEYRAHPFYKYLLDLRLQQDYENILKNQLNGHVATTVDGGDQLVSQSSDTTYDFSAGLSKEEYLDQLRQTKPLIFVNNGARDVVVSIEYYAPPEGLAISAPGLNLTVPGENKITANGFPQGNYTFCAQWQTDLDTDGDGIKDYDRMVTHIWLSSAHSDDPNTAEAVYVNSVGTATPIGRCDGFKGEAPQLEKLMTEIFMTEGDPIVNQVPSDDGTDTEGGADFWDQGTDEEEDVLPTDEDDPDEVPDEESSPEVPEQADEFSLTPAELANQGEHNYVITCERSWGFTDTNSVSANWAFTAEGVTNLGSGSSYVKISDDVYQNDFPTTITFTTSGYQLVSYVYETDSEGETTTYETNCTAIIQ